MHFSRNLTLFLLALIFGTVVLTSCNKADDTTIPTGNIRASISFTPTQDSSSCWRRYMANDLIVELVSKDDGKVLRINNTSEKANLDYGQHPYGNYQIRVTGAVREGNICTSFDQSHSKIDTLQVFTLDAPTKSLTFNITNK